MKYFLDTEFHERPHTIDLISIAVVAEDGREFYCESLDYDPQTATRWLRQNVLPSLWLNAPFPAQMWFRNAEVFGGFYDRKEIASRLLEFIGNDAPEFWGYYADYDWVVTCWLFGAMMDLPAGWPMYCRDIKQLCDACGNPTLPPQSSDTVHHALDNARWNKRAFEFLTLGGCLGQTKSASEKTLHEATEVSR